MTRKRPLADPNQYYVYIWRLEEEVIWVGHGKNNRGRPECKASWGGRPAALIAVLNQHKLDIKMQIFPCASKQVARSLEEKLIAKLNPKYNTAPGTGGYKGMHTPQGLENIRMGQVGRTWTQERREAQRKRMLGNKRMLGKFN